MTRKPTLLAVVAFMGVCPHVALALEPADSSQVLNLNEVQVVATRAAADTPIAFTNVSGSMLARSNDGRDLTYLLGFTPSVVTSSDAGAGVGYTSIRVRGTDGSRINVTANGVPLNDPESHNVYWVNMPDIAASLRDVQIQRGAGTSTNGAGAFGASINMMSESPSPAPYARAEGSYGSYNTNRQSLAVGSGVLGGHWTAEARLSHIGSDGYIDRAWSKLWSYNSRVAWFDGPSSVRLIAFGGRERTYMAWDYASLDDMKLYGRRYNPCGKYTAADGATAFYPDQTDNYTQHHLHLIFDHSPAPSLSLNLALHYTRGFGYYEQYKTRRSLVEYGLQPFVGEDGSTISRSDLVRLKNMANHFGGFVFALTHRYGSLHTTLGGGVNSFIGHHFGQVAWVRNYVGPIDPLQQYYRNTGRKTDGNIYARASLNLPLGFSAYGDLQLRHINYRIKGSSDTYDWSTEAMQQLAISRHYTFFNPKVGVNYAPDGRNRAYLSLSVAHREPTRDNFIDCAPDRQPRPERLTDWELGYAYTASKWSLGINLYHMGYHDQLVPTGQLSDTGNAVSVNVPSSRRMGVELQGSVAPAEWISWQLTTTWSSNRINNFVEYIYEDEWTNPITIDRGSTPIAFSPSLTLHSAVTLDWRNFEAELSGNYVSRQYLTNAGRRAPSLAPWFVSNLRVGYTLPSVASLRLVRLSLSVYNLFSRRYFANGYAGAGYTVGADGSPDIYRYAGYAAQAPAHVLASISFSI